MTSDHATSRAVDERIDRALRRHAIDVRDPGHGHDPALVAFTSGSRTDGEDAESSLPFIGAGFVLSGLAGALTHRVFDGVARAHGEIERFEAIHGPVLDTDGFVDYRSGPYEALEQLGDDVWSDAWLVYPFGSAVVIPLLALWAVAALLVFVDRRRWGFVVSGLGAIVLIAITASFGDTFETILAILE